MQRVRAIIKRDKTLLVIKRIKNNEIYWVLPGGGVEIGENHEQALMRECKEELGVDVLIGKFLLENIFVPSDNEAQKEFFYECEIVGGQLGVGDGPEFDLVSDYEGTRELQWIDFNKLDRYDIRPSEVKLFLIDLYKKY